MDNPQQARILPVETELSRPFWAGCEAGELRLQHCASCSQYQFYPRIICSHCGAETLVWKPVSGRGTVASFTVIRRGISRAYPAPYIVALVDLEEGPRMMSSLVGVEPESVSVGNDVLVRFEPWGEGRVLPVFALAPRA